MDVPGGVAAGSEPAEDVPQSTPGAFAGRWTSPETFAGRWTSPETFAGRLALAVRRIGLPAWFIAVDLLWVVRLDQLAIDARDYQKAATAWLGGADPWAVPGLRFAAGPHMLLFYAPTALLPPLLSEVAWTAVGLLAPVWLVRRLGVPWWWAAFPPLFHATWQGNPETLVLAFLVEGGSIAATLAAMVKLYALIPLLARPRVLALAIAGLAIAAPFLPVQQYVTDGLGLSEHLATAWNGSAARYPILIPVVLAGLWVIRRRGAEWLAVPAVWPATQFYYVAMALPAVTRRPVAAAVLALPAPLMTPLVVIALAALELRQRWPARPARARSWPPGPIVDSRPIVGSRPASGQQAAAEGGSPAPRP